MEIGSTDENKALAEHIWEEYEEENMTFWMGLTDSKKEGDWEFVSNDKPADYNNWANGQPNNGGNGGNDHGIKHYRSARQT